MPRGASIGQKEEEEEKMIMKERRIKILPSFENPMEKLDDPRRPEAVVPFKLEKKAAEEGAFDYWGLLSIALGVVALMWRASSCC